MNNLRIYEINLEKNQSFKLENYEKYKLSQFSSNSYL